jgi:hypothetical protein
MQDKMIQAFKQDLFNEIWAGASKQDFMKSYNEADDRCLYRDGENDCRCNVGFLIPDSRYSDKLEGIGVGDLYVFSQTTAYDGCKERGFDGAGFDLIQAFLCEAQEAHDNSLEADEHRRRLISLANDNKLTVPEGVAA